MTRLRKLCEFVVETACRDWMDDWIHIALSNSLRLDDKNAAIAICEVLQEFFRSRYGNSSCRSRN
jgi:hypothetical protein